MLMNGMWKFNRVSPGLQVVIKPKVLSGLALGLVAVGLISIYVQSDLSGAPPAVATVGKRIEPRKIPVTRPSVDVSEPVSRSADVIQTAAPSVPVVSHPKTSKKRVESVVPHKSIPVAKRQLDLESELLGAADGAIAGVSQDEDIASPDSLKAMGLTAKQFQFIQDREARLAREVADADRRGATQLKVLLVNDHTDWLKEYLGPIRYEKFITRVRR